MNELLKDSYIFAAFICFLFYLLLFITVLKILEDNKKRNKIMFAAILSNLDWKTKKQIWKDYKKSFEIDRDLRISFRGVIIVHLWILGFSIWFLLFDAFVRHLAKVYF